MQNIFKNQPLLSEYDIPVYSQKDAYINNYEKIAHDHLAQLKKTGKNPFFPEDLWNEVENTTLKQLKKYLKTGDRILDVGVGTGRLLSKITTDVEKYGIDISMENLIISREKGINCCFAKIEDMPYENDAFDIVVATDVLEHVLNLNFCVSKILETLKRNQYLFVRVPYKENLEPYLNKNHPHYYEFIHLRTFDEWGLKLFFEKEMKCKLVEYEFTGTYNALQRLKWGNIPPDSKLLKIAIFFIEKFKRRIKERNPDYFNNMFLPLEISCVIQKL